MNYKKLENILLYILLAVVTVVYLYTVSPTLSFWDCGEFIASAHTLAVPHPPGTPFYVVLGRACAGWHTLAACGIGRESGQKETWLVVDRQAVIQ